MTTDKARLAVIGTGWWSTYTHIPGLLDNPDAELVAMCDPYGPSLEKAKAAFGAPKAYADLGALLAAEQLDGAIVSTTHATHYEVTKTCLEAGLHVLLEKPMVLRAAHAHELIRLAEAKGRELIIGYPWHYTDLTRRARDIIGSGELGAIQFTSSLFASMTIQFYRGNDEAYRPVFNYPVTGPGRNYSDPNVSGGGQGHLQVTHSAGTLFFVTGLQAARVAAFMGQWDVQVDVVDAISAQYAPANGQTAVGTFGSTGNIAQGDGGQLETGIYCERGYLRLDQSQGTLSVRHHDGREQRWDLPVENRYPRFATSENLVNVILGRAANGSPATVGAKVVELLEAAYLSAANGGQPVNVSDL
jgi:predicted dehydrogenase